MSFLKIKHLYYILYFQSDLEAPRFVVSDNAFVSHICESTELYIGRGSWGMIKQYCKC